MKSVIVGILMIFITAELSAATDTLFQHGSDLYQEGAYEAALNEYQKIVQSGYEAPDLYYNMGNAAFRSNNIGLSILYYEKALKLDPSHRDAAHNLEFVSRYRVDAFEEVPELFLRRWISTAVHSMPESTWSILALAGFVLTMASLLVYLFTHSLALKKSGFFAALVGLVFFLFTLSSAIVQNRSITEPEQGIILSPSVTVRSTPSESGTELFILHEGTKVRVNEEVTGWHNIRIIDGREGWILSDDFELI